MSGQRERARAFSAPMGCANAHQRAALIGVWVIFEHASIALAHPVMTISSCPTSMPTECVSESRFNLEPRVRRTFASLPRLSRVFKGRMNEADRLECVRPHLLFTFAARD
jgi:hypothetical protein